MRYLCLLGLCWIASFLDAAAVARVSCQIYYSLLVESFVGTVYGKSCTVNALQAQVAQ